MADPSRIVEMLIMSLSFDFGADLEVYSDQWFAIDVEAGDYQDDIQADHPLDGMIELWFRLLEAFPGKLDRPAQGSHHIVEWSARQVARLRESSARRPATSSSGATSTRSTSPAAGTSPPA